MKRINTLAELMHQYDDNEKLEHRYREIRKRLNHVFYGIALLYFGAIIAMPWARGPEWLLYVIIGVPLALVLWTYGMVIHEYSRWRHWNRSARRLLEEQTWELQEDP